MSEINRQTALQHGRGLFDVTLSYAKHDYDVYFDGASTRSTFLANGSYPQGHGLFITIKEFHQQNDVDIYFDDNLGFFEEDGIERLKGRLEFLLGGILR
uniref:Uncharacterized protein n=1 Tax=Candidatus Kentrum sp. LFY TaxID=2126342 RepID=A0A450UMM9_9GAMM|nr:MAG: hypothetical protein BECKLFY1418A_GA0070994_103334 [Candidatus Kentron sp. LFY]